MGTILKINPTATDHSPKGENFKIDLSNLDASHENRQRTKNILTTTEIGTIHPLRSVSCIII